MRSVSILGLSLAAVWCGLTAIAVFTLANMKTRQGEVFGTVEWINRAEAVHVELDELHAAATVPGADAGTMATQIADRQTLTEADVADFAPPSRALWKRHQTELDAAAANPTTTAAAAAALDSARRVVRDQVQTTRADLEASARKMSDNWLILMSLFVALLLGGAILVWTFMRALKRTRLLEELRDGADSLSDSLRIEMREIQDVVRALEKSEARYRSVVEMQTDLVSRMQPDGRLKFVNEAFAHYWDMVAAELAGTSVYELMAEHERAAMRAHIAAFTKDRPVQSFEVQMVRADGTMAWQLWTHRALFNSDEEIVEFQSTGRDVTKRREAEDKLRASEQRLRILAARIQTAREDERKAIARELHDDLGQSLTRLRVEIVLAERACHDVKLREDMREMLGLVDSAIAGVRHAATQLRPPLLDSMGLPAALERLADEFAKHTRIASIKDVDDVAVPQPAAIAMYRVAQEALTNVARHAQAQRVVIRLYRDEARVVLEVQDDGRGMDADGPDDPSSTGLINMQERAEALGGEFRIESEPGRGTRIVFAVPTEEQEEAA